MWAYRKFRCSEESGYFWYYQQGFYENPARSSRAKYTDRHIFELYFNVHTPAPLNPIATRSLISNRLKRLIGIPKYICCVSASQGSRSGDGGYVANIQFYCRPKVLPEEKVMEAVPAIIEDSLVIATYIKTLPTGETEYYTYEELPEDYKLKRAIIRQSMGNTQRTKQGKPLKVLGGVWSFADCY